LNCERIFCCAKKIEEGEGKSEPDTRAKITNKKVSKKLLIYGNETTNMHRNNFMFLILKIYGRFNLK
jgi:hypothetical protein